MTRLKPYLKNLARCALLLNVSLVLVLIFGCSSSTKPTYLKENIANSIQNICKKEYNLDVKTKLIGETVWVYLPLKDIFVKSDKPEKYLQRFAIDYNMVEFNEDMLKLKYLIQAIPPQEKYQEIKYEKSLPEKINNVWKVLRRVIFSMEDIDKNGPHFFVLVIADIKNGYVIKEVFYYLDFKKVSYNFISWTEYQHRTISDMEIATQIIGDRQGESLNYTDITLDEFIAYQIQYRIRIKFQKPEVEPNVDIDNEILKVVVFTLKTYGFSDFSTLELNNLFTNNKTKLNQEAIW